MSEWYSFLSSQRNFSSHRGAPYCALEETSDSDLSHDLLVMTTNVITFTTANQSDWFRLSECRGVLAGTRELSAAAEQFLLDIIQEAPIAATTTNP